MLIAGAASLVLPRAVEAQDFELEFLAQVGDTQVSLVGGDGRTAWRTLTPFLVGCDGRWV